MCYNDNMNKQQKGRKKMTDLDCDICMNNPATTQYKSGVRGKYWEYYCADCDTEYGFENQQAGYEQKEPA